MQGSICLRISDQELDLSKIDDKLGIHNSRMIFKNQQLHGNRTSKYNIWLYKEKYYSENDFDKVLYTFIDLLNSRKEIMKELKVCYEEVCIIIYLCSEYGQIGYSLKKEFIEKLQQLDMDISFDILSFGLVEDM